METKMITIPFDVERAKRIQAGEEPGKIVTRAGRNVRVVCWDRQDDTYPIIALLWNKERSNEACRTYMENGYVFEDGEENQYDLTLQIPEWTQYKDGDILTCEKEIGKRSYSKYLYILKDNVNFTEFSIHFKSYVSYDCNPKDKYDELNELEYDDGCSCLGDSIRLATEEEKQQLIDVLKASTDPQAKEYLKRFLGIEEKQECEFEPKDWVLGRMVSKTWCLCQFSHKETLFDGKVWYVAIGGIGYSQCIPYNDQTKHLLGTTDDWEE